MGFSIRVIKTRFDPRSIANLTGWFDALDTAGYIDSSGQVTDWLDKSGGGRNVTQTTANNRPTLFESSGNIQNTTRAVLNGRQALYFDGINDRLTSSAEFTSTHARTTFVVTRTVGTTANQAVFSIGTVGGGGVVRFTPLEGSATVGTKLVLTDGVAVNTSITADRNSTLAHISCHQQATGRTIRYFLNGTEATTSGTPSAQTAFGGLSVGFRGDASGGLSGYIGELLIYDRELLAGERAAITAYLGARWGITVA